LSKAGTELRDTVADQLDALLTGPLSPTSLRVIALAARHLIRGSAPTPQRLRLWREIEDRYLARQSGIERDGRAALVTAGPPGAGKSTAVLTLGLVDDGWRRLDADIVKDYLLEDLVADGEVDDVLAMTLRDGRAVMPRELAGMVHAESVLILDQIRGRCLSAAENVIVEGTLSWEPAALKLVDDLARSSYRELSILDVEVPRDLAWERALQRWWTGRQENTDTLGGRWMPPAAIDRIYPDLAQARSVCAATARTVFDSPVVAFFPRARLTVIDNGDLAEAYERRAGVLQSSATAADTELPPATQLAPPSSHPRRS
jgi:hypothetical protein